MRTKLFLRLLYLLLLFQTPCFAALPTASSDSTNVANVSNKDHAICNTCSKNLKPKTSNPMLQIEESNPLNQLVVDNFVREVKSQGIEKTIPDEIKKLCVKFCMRGLPWDCIKEEYKKILPQLDNNEDRKKAIELFLCYKIEEEKDDLGTTILHKACQKGYLNIVQRLIFFNANIEIKSKYDTTPLLFACQNGHQKIVKLLLDNGANIKALNRSNCTGLVEAYKNRQKELAKCRIKKGRSKVYYSCLSVTCMMGYTETLKVLLDKGADINKKTGRYGLTALHEACWSGSKETARLLLDNGANINAKDNDGWTPLHYAVKYNNNKEVASFLIENKANIDVKNNDEFTALHFAVKYKKKDFTELLIKYGANPHARRWLGDSPLDIAIKNKDEEMISYLKSVEPKPSVLPYVCLYLTCVVLFTATTIFLS